MRLSIAPLQAPHICTCAAFFFAAGLAALVQGQDSATSPSASTDSAKGNSAQPAASVVDTSTATVALVSDTATADSVADTLVSPFAYDTVPDTVASVQLAPITPVTARVAKPAPAWLRTIGYLFGAIGRYPPVAWVLRYLLQIVVLIISVWAIWYALNFYATRRDRERFLSSDRLSLMDKEVQKACLMVEECYADQAMTPQTLCERLVTGESFLESLFARELGMSITEFIEHVRVNRVAQTIRANPQLPVEELATLCGFGAVESLSAAFEKITELQVERYREAIGAGEDPLA